MCKKRKKTMCIALNINNLTNSNNIGLGCHEKATFTFFISTLNLMLDAER